MDHNKRNSVISAESFNDKWAIHLVLVVCYPHFKEVLYLGWRRIEHEMRFTFVVRVFIQGFDLVYECLDSLDVLLLEVIANKNQVYLRPEECVGD